MGDDNSRTFKPVRGRPKGGCKAKVMQKLFDAAEVLLEQHGQWHATERMIAATAGVNPAMIHYYFGGMDGLLFALVDRIASQISEEYVKLHNNTEWHGENPTRHLVRVLIDAYYAKPWLARIICSEVTQSSSVVRDLFLKRHGPQGLVQIRRVLNGLVEIGIYSNKVDTAYVALSMFSVIIAPLSLTLITGSMDIGLDDLRKDRWIDHITEQFDRQLRPAAWTS